MSTELQRKLSDQGKELLRLSLEIRSVASEDGETDSMFEDDASWVEEEQEGDEGVEWADDVENRLQDAVDMLRERKGNLKSNAYVTLNNLMCRYVLTYLDETLRSTVTPEILANFKRKSAEELALGCKTLALLAVTLGADEDGFYKDVKTPLARLVAEGDLVTKPAALLALGIACFVCSTDENETGFVMDLCHSVIKKTKKKVHADLALASMVVWGLHLTSLYTSDAATDLGDESSSLFNQLETLVNFLTHSNSEVRAEAGELFALAVEVMRSGNRGWDLYDDGNFWIDALAKIEELKRETSKKVSKKTRKSQRKVFRNIHSSVVDGQTPSLTIRIGSEAVTFSSWSEMKQLKVFKTVLGKGFQEHITNNPLLGDIFGYGNVFALQQSAGTDDSRKIVEKGSAIEKERKAERTKDRKHRHQAMNAYWQGSVDEV